jgi:hypothetical protein
MDVPFLKINNYCNKINMQKILEKSLITEVVNNHQCLSWV